ncbi:Otogelin-like protein [Acipenser ruthenus]|uniref:Otogelin-like protein n=1 Tax=Acipenser ruthenus TaxID=7906 RepID=A0A662YYZ3_ACIRT|nr:Otogelin-like protein [Acipenser ruthenus]
MSVSLLIIELPHVVHDVEVERISQYTLVTLQHGFTLAWDGSTSSVYIKMSPEYVGRTCGLCGNFNADVHDDLKTSYDLFTHDTAIFGNSWMEMVPHEYSCPSVPANYPSPCLTQNYETRQKVQEMCILLLETPFKECHDLVSPFPFMASCSNDLCIAGLDNQVLCQALTEYARACAHAEHPLYDWRAAIPMCAVECDDKFIYRECITCCPVSCKIDKMCIDSKLQCLDGCYCPEGECSVTGDIHFDTFDGRVYTFQATCQYILAKSRSTGKFTISLQNAPCGANLDGACIQSVNIIVDEDPMKQITVNNIGEVYVSNLYRITPPYSDGVFQIHELSSMFLQVKTEDGLRLQYNWKELRLYLEVDESWKEDTVGLCGTFNGNIQDDFLSPAGMIESTPQLFGNSWKLSSACVPGHSIPQLDPCDIHQQAASYASEMCEILNKELFAPCHGYLSPAPFYQQCKSDTCKCGETCLCAALAHYARQCRKHGVVIDFRAHVSECAAQCQETMKYGTCISSCNSNCRSLSLSEDCGEECVEGCVCPGGTYYNSKSQKCVQKNECSCNFLGAEYGPGDIIMMSSGAQICKDGQMMYQGPSLDTKCPPGQFYFKCSDSLDSSTVSKGVACERTCESHLLNLTCSGHGHCVSGCICPPGFLKHGDECFEPIACPCLWKGKEYYPGDKVTSPCHNCVCQHGSFQCIFHPCPSMCTAYGDRHYRTFDGLLFDYIGACKVYLVKSNIDLTMSVAAENVDCYESGVICRKSLLINIGRSFIVFDNDSGKPNPSSLIDKRQPVFIWQAGYYTIVHIPTEDVTVLWDRKTTIHIQVGPRWQGKLTGLCGNFDLKTVNEMRSPENIESATAQEFGNSWTAAECVNSPDIRNPCSMNPLREPFAKRECGILLSEVFEACHPVVDVTWFYMNCLTDTCGCNRGGDCECFCTSVSAYAHRCCQQGITVDWRSPTVCPYDCEFYNKAYDCEFYNKAYDCEFYNKVLGKGPYKLVTYLESETVLAAHFSGAAAFPVQGAVSIPGVAMLFMLTPGLSRSKPHDTTLVSLEAAERPNYFLHLGPNGYLRVTKWEESDQFQEASTFIIHKDTWLAGYDSFESYMKPGFFVHYMLSSIHLMKYNHSVGFRQATLFKLEGIKPAVAVEPITPQSTVSTPGAVTSPSVNATVSLGSTLSTAAPIAAARTTTETQRTSPTPTSSTEASFVMTISPKPLGPTIQTTPGDTTESLFTTITTLAPDVTKPEGAVTFSPTPQYSEIIDDCTKYVCMNGQLMLFNKSQNCPYNATPPNCGLLGFAILVNGDKCCPQWDCPCRCSVFPDLNIITFDGNSVAIYKAASYIVTQLPNETVSIQVQECQSSDTLLWNFTNLCLVALNITHKAHQVLIDRLQRRKNGFEILDTGNMYLIKTPAGLKIQWFHSTGMMVIETDSPSHKLTTMGLCGCCDGDPTNDLTLFNGTTVSESEDPTVFIDSWQVPNTTSFMGQNRRREVNCSTSDCSECLSMLSNQTFSSCHAFVPPKMFCEVWVRDAEYVKSPCTALAAYVAACHKFSICIEWRSPDYCSFMCPPELRYQACLPACNAKTCPNHEFDSDPEECSGLTEGCVCPEGTVLHRPYSALCIPSEKCACTDSFGTPHASGEVWKASKDGCCMYKCDNDSIIPVEHNCTKVPEPVCSKAGEVTVSLADDKSCCPQKACVCNQTLCDQYAPECKYGEKLVSYYRDYSCCPDYICECDPDRCESDIPTCRDDQTLIATQTEGSCCMAYICKCACDTIPKPQCKLGEMLQIDNEFLADPENQCGCSKYKCVKEQVCVDGERGVMRPGQTLVEHTAEGICYTTQCTSHTDPVTSFYKIQVSRTNCTAQCEPPGTTWMFNCKTYECTDTTSGPTLISYSISCPPFNETECMKVSMNPLSPMNPFLYSTSNEERKEDGKSCQKVTVRMTIRKNDCRSNRPDSACSVSSEHEAGGSATFPEQSKRCL